MPLGFDASVKGVHGMDLTLIVSAAIVAVGAVLAALFLPRHTSPTVGPPAVPEPATDQPTDSRQR